MLNTPPQVSVQRQAPAPPAKPPRRKLHPILFVEVLVGIGFFLYAAGVNFTGGNRLMAVAYGAFALMFVFPAILGWVLGDAFRRFAKPDFYFASGAMGLAQTRLFWMFGPQSVGVLAAFFVLFFIGMKLTDVTGSAIAASSAPTASAAAQDTPPSATPPSSAAASAAPEPAAPKFTDDLAFASYPAEIYKGPIAAPNFGGGFQPSDDERSHILDAVKSGPNFAGEIAVAEIGCGMGCRTAYAVNVRTGVIYDLPIGGPPMPSLMLTYDPSSMLMQAQWDGTDTDHATCIRTFYQWTGEALRTLQKREIDGQCSDVE